jgi:phospholipid/cholesterol/gamma-HCH transport system ATP-binding protein|tara:strand:+ start:576 stop:1286 length:711 start_codon:yes stop_codon:yes gene_type:complete
MHNTIFLENVNVHFEQKQILSKISFDVSPNKSVCLIGKGLSGKSTILKSIAGLVQISRGDIKIGGISVKEKNIVDVYETLGMVFEKDALFDSLKVWENIMFKSLNKKKKSELISNSKSFLKIVGLSDKDAELFPAELSGGMKKRVAIARAISHNPSFLLLDDPTAGLDPVKTNMIFDIVKKLSKKLKITVLAVSSDIKGAMNYFDEFVVIEDSKVHWSGKKNDLLKKPTKLIKDLL